MMHTEDIVMTGTLENEPCNQVSPLHPNPPIRIDQIPFNPPVDTPMSQSSSISISYSHEFEQHTAKHGNGGRKLVSAKRKGINITDAPTHATANTVTDSKIDLSNGRKTVEGYLGWTCHGNSST